MFCLFSGFLWALGGGTQFFYLLFVVLFLTAKKNSECRKLSAMVDVEKHS